MRPCRASPNLRHHHPICTEHLKPRQMARLLQLATVAAYAATGDARSCTTTRVADMNNYGKPMPHLCVDRQQRKFMCENAHVAPHLFCQLSLSPLHDHARAGSLISYGGSFHSFRHRLVQRDYRFRCDTLRPGEHMLLQQGCTADTATSVIRQPLLRI